ncbi:MAG: hypothetical protein WCI17_00770 [bacterium]
MVSLSKRLMARLALPILAKSKTYQSVYLNGTEIRKGRRNILTRWQAIEGILENQDVRSVLDIGCAEGFFVRKAAEKGCFATGVDADGRRLLWGSATLCMDDVDQVAFVKMMLTRDNLSLLSPADMVINLSLTHHIMYKHGEPYALEFVRAARALTRKVMIFEMGQSNEVFFAWSKLLPDMGSDPHAWIEGFLMRCGFARVEKICTVEAHKGGGIRATFAAYI